MSGSTYDLKDIQASIRRPKDLKTTGTAQNTIDTLGFTDERVIETIQALTDVDFYKTMAPNSPHHTNMQDVYKSTFDEIELYIKFQRSVSNRYYLVLSFKEK